MKSHIISVELYTYCGERIKSLIMQFPNAISINYILDWNLDIEGKYRYKNFVFFLTKVIIYDKIIVGDIVKVKKTYGILVNLALVTQIGLSMVLPVIGGVWLGHFIDEKLGFKFLFLILFIFFGVGLSFYSLYNLTSKGANKRK